MPTSPYGLKDDYVSGAPPSASDLNRRADILRAQLPAALEAIGEGVLPVPDVTSLLVTGSGGSVSVAEGAALVRSEAGYLYYVENLADQDVTGIVSGDINYIFIVSYLSGNPALYDSETARLCRLASSDSDTYPGGLLLAEIAADGTITDRRIMTGSAGLFARVTTLEAAEVTIDTRLDTLESGATGTGGDGSGGVSLAAFAALRALVTDLQNQVADLTRQQSGDAPVSIRLAGRTEVLRSEFDLLRLHDAEIFPRLAQVEDDTVVTERTAQGQPMPDGTAQRDDAGGDWPVD